MTAAAAAAARWTCGALHGLTCSWANVSPGTTTVPLPVVTATVTSAQMLRGAARLQQRRWWCSARDAGDSAVTPPATGVVHGASRAGGSGADAGGNDDSGASSGSGAADGTSSSTSSSSSSSSLSSSSTHSSTSSPSASGPPAVQRVPFRSMELPCVPLYRRPLFPGIIAPILVQDASACEAFLSLKNGGTRYAGLFLHRHAGRSDSGAPGAHPSDAAQHEQQQYSGSDPAAGGEHGEMSGRDGGGGGVGGGDYEITGDASLSSSSSATPASSPSASSFAMPQHGAGVPDPNQLYHVGVIGELLRVAPRPKGLELTFMCHHRIRLDRPTRTGPLLFAETSPIAEDRVEQGTSIRAYSLAVVETLKELLSAGSLYKEQLQLLLESVDVNNPYHLADLGACLSSTAEPAALQGVLEEPRLEERLSKTLSLLKAELETIRVQRKISKQIEENVSSAQRKFFLNEQLKYIKRELGIERDERESVANKFRERLIGRTVPAHASSVIDDEMQKLGTLEPSSSEYNVTRNYLDWLTALPWGVHSADRLAVDHGRAVLDADHYGMEDVKRRIAEFIAIGALKGTVEGKILLLSGPPGVGKTTIGKSIARALDRRFYRFSVGGMSDVAEIRGHRRTYVGAMPGKFIQALKATQTQNPLVLIDEIDKLGRGWHGDPASALLEALDPEQNSGFQDHYLDLPVDLSKALFVCTANVTDTIPAPLYDRMENISLSGYILDEKVAIAKRHLVPQARKAAGLTTRRFIVRDGALRALAKDYSREAGVRGMQKQVDKLCRRAAYRLVTGETSEPVVVNTDTLVDLIGKPPFGNELVYKRLPLGVARGLAWTSVGGAVLYVESIHVGSSGGGGSGATLRATGQIGEVMRESSDIAFSFARQHVQRREPANRFFERCHVHMHVPEGATPKDGPSAGCTMVTSLVSLATGRPIASDLAMTGEMTLTGRVLPVGGIREKVVAAKRAGLKRVVLPAANRSDWDELPAYVRQGMRVLFADVYDDVYRAAFEPDGASRRVLEAPEASDAEVSAQRRRRQQQQQQQHADEGDARAASPLANV